MSDERRHRDFAYLATLALLVLRGDVELGEPLPIGEQRSGGSYFTKPFRQFGLLATHKLVLSTQMEITYPTGEPRELAEALLTELTR